MTLRYAGFHSAKQSGGHWPIIGLQNVNIHMCLTGCVTFRVRDWFSEWWRVVHTIFCEAPLLRGYYCLLYGYTVYNIQFSCCLAVCRLVNVKLSYLHCGCRRRDGLFHPGFKLSEARYPYRLYLHIPSYLGQHSADKNCARYFRWCAMSIYETADSAVMCIVFRQPGSYFTSTVRVVIVCVSPEPIDQNLPKLASNWY